MLNNRDPSTYPGIMPSIKLLIELNTIFVFNFCWNLDK